MKYLLLFTIFCMAFLAACAPQAQEPAGAVLKVSDGTTEKTYTADDLKALGEVQATLKDVTYVGVNLTVLLEDAGIDPTSLTAVKAVAMDGFTANYESALYSRADTIVAYARVDGPLSEEEAPFCMVLPNEAGKMNPRQLTDIKAIP